MRRAPAILLALLALGGCEQAGQPGPAREAVDLEAIVQPEFGSNQIFNEALSAAQDHDLIVADLRLPPNAVGEAHYHPWEEYLYVLGGEAVLDIEGMEQRTIGPGETAVIPAETVHTPRAGPHGIRAIIVRVHDAGDPLTVPVGEASPAP